GCCERDGNCFHWSTSIGCSHDLVQGFLGELLAFGKQAELETLLADLIEIPLDEIGDDLDGHADAQPMLQIVQLRGRPRLAITILQARPQALCPNFNQQMRLIANAASPGAQFLALLLLPRRGRLCGCAPHQRLSHPCICPCGSMPPMRLRSRNPSRPCRPESA